MTEDEAHGISYLRAILTPAGWKGAECGRSPRAKRRARLRVQGATVPGRRRGRDTMSIGSGVGRVGYPLLPQTGVQKHG